MIFHVEEAEYIGPLRIKIRMDFKPGERFHPDVDDLVSICHKAFLADVHGIILTHRAHGDLCVMINFIHNDDGYWQWGWDSCSAVYLTEQKQLLRVVDSWIRQRSPAAMRKLP